MKRMHKGKIAMRQCSLVICLCLLFSSIPGMVLAASSSYTLGPSDVLEISVWRDDSLSREVIVPPDGVISFPLIGDIDVIGKTVADLRNTVTKKLSTYVPDATVTVIIKSFNSLRAFVIGKVNKPGVYPITLNTNVMQLLSMAGGLNAYASESNIHILRQVEGGTVKIPFSYGDVLKGRHLDQNITLQRGDVVVVP
jgi:polysaccharide biosynthesis/export protein